MTLLSLPYTWPLDLTHALPLLLRPRTPVSFSLFLPLLQPCPPSWAQWHQNLAILPSCIPASSCPWESQAQAESVSPSSPSFLHGTCSRGEPWGVQGWRDASTPVSSFYHNLMVLCSGDPSAPVKVFSNFPLLYRQSILLALICLAALAWVWLPGLGPPHCSTSSPGMSPSCSCIFPNLTQAVFLLPRTPPANPLSWFFNS